MNKGLLHTFENSSPEEQQEQRGGWSHRSGRAAPVPSGRVRSLALGDSVTTPVCSTVFPLARLGKVGVKGAEACTSFHRGSSEAELREAGFPLFLSRVLFFSLIVWTLRLILAKEFTWLWLPFICYSIILVFHSNLKFLFFFKYFTKPWQKFSRCNESRIKAFCPLALCRK